MEAAVTAAAAEQLSLEMVARTHTQSSLHASGEEKKEEVTVVAGLKPSCFRYVCSYITIKSSWYVMEQV